MFAASIVLAGGGHDKILMVWSPFVHLSRLFIAGIVKCFVRSHFPPSHVPAGSSLINLLSIHPTTPSLYKKFTFSTALCGSIDTHILFVCVCVYTHRVFILVCWFGQMPWICWLWPRVYIDSFYSTLSEHLQYM
jgi:hypothetical protein